MLPTASDSKDPLKASVVYRFWGALDMLYVGVYVSVALAKGEMPFVEDVAAIVQILKVFDQIGGTVIVSLYVMLFMSLAVSGVLLLLTKPVGKVIAYAQTPFRLLFIMPSFSILGFAAFYFEASTAVLVTGLVLSEVSKVGSLLRWGLTVPS